jgi:hypothetical protein
MKTLIAALMLISPANANGIDMIPLYENQVQKASHVQKAKPKVYKSKPKKRKAYSFRPAPPPLPSDGSRCFEPVTVVGSQWVGESGAYESAVKAAKEAVRWKIGEMAMDPANWKDVKKRCSMSSVGEVVGQTFHRCEIIFTPCRPGMTESGQ